MVSEQTPRGYQLPHPSNELEADVLRLRAALQSISDDVQLLVTLVASNDPTLDTVQELVNQIKANKTTVDALLSTKADQAAVDGQIQALQQQLTTASNNMSTLAGLIYAGL